MKNLECGSAYGWGHYQTKLTKRLKWLKCKKEVALSWIIPRRQRQPASCTKRIQQNMQADEDASPTLTYSSYTTLNAATKLLAWVMCQESNGLDRITIQIALRIHHLEVPMAKNGHTKFKQKKLLEIEYKALPCSKAGSPPAGARLAQDPLFGSVNENYMKACFMKADPVLSNLLCFV